QGMEKIPKNPGFTPPFIGRAAEPVSLQPTSLRFPEPLLKRLDEYARLKGVTRSEVILKLLDWALDYSAQAEDIEFNTRRPAGFDGGVYAMRSFRKPRTKASKSPRK